MNDYVAWRSDNNILSGESFLAKKFLKIYSKKKIKITSPKRSFFTSNYIYPFIGLIILWINYFKGKKTIYINFLPLWNVFLFLLLPPKTIIGPVTGSIQINEIKSTKSLIRYYIFPILYKISLKILFLRKKKVLFATNILKKFVKNKDKSKCIFNFVLKDFYIKKNKYKKKYNLIFYYRKHENKIFSHHINFLNKLLKNKKQIIVVGDILNLKGIKNFKNVGQKKLIKLIKLSSMALSGDDNFLSIFNLQCISQNTKLIYNSKLNFQNDFFNKDSVIQYDFKKNKFIPPSKKKNFNNQLVKNINKKINYYFEDF